MKSLIICIVLIAFCMPSTIFAFKKFLFNKFHPHGYGHSHGYGIPIIPAIPVAPIVPLPYAGGFHSYGYHSYGGGYGHGGGLFGHGGGLFGHGGLFGRR